MPEPAATVFVVEDDPSVREALAGLIRSAGWSVEVFDSAHDSCPAPAEAPSAGADVCFRAERARPHRVWPRHTTTSRRLSRPGDIRCRCRMKPGL